LDCGTVFRRLGGNDRGRCPPCRRANDRQRQARRGTAAERGYDAAWQRLRLRILERDGYICHWCTSPANTVDHVVPLVFGGARLDESNLVAACLSCNASRGGKARAEAKRRREARW
jgi:5-methylcytosine-specific restriction protein A